MRYRFWVGVMGAGLIIGSALADELASVNGTPITTEALRQKLAEPPAPLKESIHSPEGRREILDILITRELLYQEAVKRHLEKERVIQAKMAEARRSVLVEAMMDRLTARMTAGNTLKDYYASHRNEFREIRASHILVEKEEEARNLKQQLNAGADFAELARKFSQDARSGPTGGDLGYFTKGRMIPEIANAAFRLRVNEISEPVKSYYGYHLIKVTDAPEAKRFEELPTPVLEEIKRAVLQEEIQALRAANNVTVNTDRLEQLR
ncbi:MAG TPA: peptidylprolyl isomerase [Nitrospiria bacterium]|nr:peptidylprolyl isomerase [Nitrospiria bacterium]